MLRQLGLLTLAASSVYGHAFVNSISGANGLTAVGLGVTTNGEVPRGGTTEQPFQLDTPVLKNLKDDPCGATLLAGSVKIPESMAKIAAVNGGQFPSIPTDGKLTMGVFQVNADGGGPFKADINTDATGKTWSTLAVTAQPPGKSGLLHNGPANSTITVEVPAGIKCTGGANKNACLIRLNNGGPGTGSVANGAGPFGGCAAVQQGGAAAAGASAAGAAQQATPVARRELIAELQRRQKLTQHMIDELKTATGTAIDIPIDALAGHDDAAALGGNSTGSAPGAVLTTQQAVNLKKAVAAAIEQALIIMSNDDQIDAGAAGTSEAAANKANDDAKAALSAGVISSINAGNAGVGAAETASVSALLGGLATAAAAVSKGAATGVASAAATITAAAAGATDTVSATLEQTTIDGDEVILTSLASVPAAQATAAPAAPIVSAAPAAGANQAAGQGQGRKGKGKGRGKGKFANFRPVAGAGQQQQQVRVRSAKFAKNRFD
jgi:hypothetical protein